MKKLGMILMVVATLSFVAAHAEPMLGEEGAKKSSDGKVIYPKEIENCEPCKRLWLANNLKHKKNAVQTDKKAGDSKGGAATTLDVKGN